jgi:hypothetical protein
VVAIDNGRGKTDVEEEMPMTGSLFFEEGVAERDVATAGAEELNEVVN